LGRISIKQLFFFSTLFFFYTTLQAETLRVGVLESDFMGYIKPDKQLGGFEVEIAQTLCQRLKAQCQIKLQPFSVNLEDLKKNNIDFAVSSILVTPERKKHLLFSNRYMRSFSVFIGPAKQPKNRRIRVASVKGSVQEHYLRQQKASSMDSISFMQLNESYEALLNGEVDQVLGPAMIQLGFVSDHSEAEYELLGEPIREYNLGGDVAVALPKNETALKDRINDILTEMLTDGSYNQLNKKYFPFSIY